MSYSFALTTIPPRWRAGTLAKCLAALSAQTCPPEEILLGVPHGFKWDARFADEKEDLATELKGMLPACVRIVEVPAGVDDGPWLKYWAARDANTDWVTIVDDDQEYHAKMMANTLPVLGNARCVYQNCFWECLGGGPGGGGLHGFLGLTVAPSALADLITFPTPPGKCFVDDCLMGIYFWHHGLTITGTNNFHWSHTFKHGTATTLSQSDLYNDPVCGQRKRLDMVRRLDAFYSTYQLRFQHGHHNRHAIVPCYNRPRLFIICLREMNDEWRDKIKWFCVRYAEEQGLDVNIVTTPPPGFDKDKTTEKLVGRALAKYYGGGYITMEHNWDDWREDMPYLLCHPDAPPDTEIHGAVGVYCMDKSAAEVTIVGRDYVDGIGM